MKRPLVIALAGMTCCGKDTALTACLNRAVVYSFELEKAIADSTRPIRTGEINGVTYNFLSKKEMKKKEGNHELISIHDYLTEFGVWSYALSKNAIYSTETNKIHITNADEFHDLIKAKEAGDIDLITFYLHVSNPILVQRLLNNDERNVEESLRRYRQDYDKYIAIKSQCDFVIDCTNLTPEQIGNDIVIIANSLAKKRDGDEDGR